LATRRAVSVLLTLTCYFERHGQSEHPRRICGYKP